MKFTLKKDHLIYVLLCIVVLIAIIPWFKQGIAVTDDFRHHITKFWFLKESFAHGGYSAWNPYLYSGNLLLHFYHPGSYFFSLPLMLMFNPTTALKASIILAYIVCAIGTFVAVDLFFKKKEIALVAATAYLFSVVRVAQANATGAIPRVWSMALAPLAMIFFFQAIDKKDYKSIALSALFAAACTLANVPTMYPIAIVCLIYYLFNLKRSDWKNSLLSQTKTTVIIMVLAMMLVSFWFFPMIVEQQYGNMQQGSPSGTPTPPGRIFIREFGKMHLSNGEVKDSFYLGYSILLLAAAGAFLGWKDKKIRFLTTSFLIILFLDFFPGFLKYMPYASIGLQGTDVYFTMMTSLLLALLCGFGVYTIHTSIRKKALAGHLLYIVMIAVILIDVAPGAYTFSYGWVKQPDWKFSENDATIDAWQKIGSVPGDFRVFSVVGLVPFMYHGKQEIGYGWQGDPQAPVSTLFKLDNEIHDIFTKNPVDQSTNKVLGYLGARFYVLPCIKDYEKFAPLFYSNGQVCVYQNPFYSPLVISPENITIKKSIDLQGIMPNSAFVEEECSSNCFIKNEPAEIANVKWELKQISFDVNAIHKSYILIKSTYVEPHWSVYVNKQKAGVKKAWPYYYLIEVPDGKSQVVLKYGSNKTHLISGLISAAGLAIVLYLLLFRKGKKHGTED